MLKTHSLPQRLLVAGLSLVTGLIFIVALHIIFPKDSTFASILTDYTSVSISHPISIQNIMWLVFFLGLGELFGRLSDTFREEKQLKQRYLPEDERTILQTQDLGKVYKNIRDRTGEQTELFLPRLIKRVILQFQSSRAIEQANALLNSSLDMYLHEIDLRYSIIRYIVWLIPSLGFIGTVIGISIALNYASIADVDDPKLLSELSIRLAVAFYTTLLALIQAAILVFGLHIVQAKEERCLNRSGQYCLDNLINRLYTAN